MRTAWNRELGTKQGRIRPASVPSISGDYAFCLGFDDPGHFDLVTPGDFVLIEQRAVFTPGTKLLRIRANVRPPKAVPIGHKWVLEVMLDDVVKSIHTLAPGGPTRARLFSVNVSKVAAGSHTVTVRLRLLRTDSHQYISQASFEVLPEETVFDPATMAWGLWSRASFAVTPWPGVASLGGSGAVSLTEVTNPPTVGTPRAGLTPAALNGTTQRLNGPNASTLFTNTAGTIAAFVHPAAAAADPGANGRYDSPAIFTSTNGGVYLTYTSAGFGFGGFVGITHNSVDAPAIVGQPHFVVATWDASKIYLSVDGAIFEEENHGVTIGANPVLIGTNYASAAFLNASLFEVMAGQFTASMGDVANLANYFMSRYEL